MGVIGLWSIVDSVGHPIDLDTLTNKVVAIDLSLWVNQSIKGIRGRNGQTVENAHVLGLFHRISKLLFYRIKPVFVFDGSCPQLKRNTIGKRVEQRLKAIDKSRESSIKVLQNYIASQVSTSSAKNLLNTESLPSLQSSLLHMPDNNSLKIYKELNELEKKWELSGSEDSDETEPNIAHNYSNLQNLDSIDMNSEDFNRLPPEIKFEILTELKQKFKGYRNTGLMPKESNDFSSFQLQRLLKKRGLQSKIEETIRQLNGENTKTIIDDLDRKEFCLDYESNAGRLLSDENTRFVFLKRSQPIGSQNSSENNTIDDRVTKIPSISVSTKVNESTDNSCLIISDTSDSEEVSTNFIINSEIKPKNCEKLEEKQILTEIMSQNSIEISDESDVEKYDKLKENIQLYETNDKNNEKLNLNHNLNDFTKIKEIEINSDSSDDDFESVASEEWPKTPDSLHDFIDKLSENLVSSQKSSEIVTNAEESALNRFEAFVESSDFEIIDITRETVSDIPEPSLPSTSELKESPNDMKSSSSQSVPFESLSREELMETTREMNKQNRFANHTTDQMMTDCQELLRLFGIPFVVSPMEAEAQCAALEELGLIDGTITDDSDVLLFGAQTVYKNFFTSSKYVELYKSSDIETRFGLTRSSMICIALLCGSDYTDGVDGVGAVTATEILSEFPGDGLKPLIDFKNWLNSKHKSKDMRPENPIRAKFLKLKPNESFPNKVIFDAYMCPTVDNSCEKFSWAMPQLDQLRRYASDRFGWTSAKTDQILVPLMKKVNEKQTQMTIDHYFKAQVQPKDTTFQSKRLSKAINKLRGIESVPQTSQSNKNKAISALSQKVKNQRKRRQTNADKNKTIGKCKPNTKRQQLADRRPKEIDLSESSTESD